MIAAWPAYDVAGQHENGGSGAAARRQSGTMSACMHCRQVRNKPGSVSSPLLPFMWLKMYLPTWQ